jgi:hypothetical protein
VILAYRRLKDGNVREGLESIVGTMVGSLALDLYRRWELQRHGAVAGTRVAIETAADHVHHALVGTALPWDAWYRDLPDGWKIAPDRTPKGRRRAILKKHTGEEALRQSRPSNSQPASGVPGASPETVIEDPLL